MTRSVAPTTPTWRPSDLPYPTPGERPIPLRVALAEWSDLDAVAGHLRLATGRALARSIGGGSPSQEEVAELRRLLGEAQGFLDAATGGER